MIRNSSIQAWIATHLLNFNRWVDASVSIFLWDFLWSNVFPFHIQIFEYLARVAWAWPMLASQIAYRPRQRPQGQKCLLHRHLLVFTYPTWTLELGKNQISKALDIWVRSLQSIFEKNGRQKYVSWWPYLGRISINRRWTVGSRRLEHGRDDKSGVPLTTLLPHQLYKPFFSREGGTY